MDEISIGDKVNVFFSGLAVLYNCEVLKIPVNVGDWWCLKDEGGKIYNVLLFERMEKL